MDQRTPVATDRSLVEQIWLGDWSALAELRRRHGLTLYAIAYTAVLDPEAADIIVASVFSNVSASPALVLAHPVCVFAWLVSRVRLRVARHHDAAPRGRRLVRPAQGLMPAIA